MTAETPLGDTGAGVVSGAMAAAASPGTIAVLPRAEPTFTAAATEAGGTVAPLGPETVGIVWLDQQGAEALGAVLRAHPAVRWVQLPWAGVDAFARLLREESRPGLVWTSAKGAFAPPVAEHALALTLALLRGLPERARATTWGGKGGRSLHGLRVVIVGAGGIALELIRLLEPFGVDLTVVRRRPVEVPGARRTVTSEQLGEVLSETDVLVLAAALTGAEEGSGTRGLIGARELAALPADAVLVNIARGGLVDTEALVSALAGGRLAGAALDVTDPEPLPEGHPLWSEPRALITPHTADTPEMTAPLLAERIRHNVRALHGSGGFAGLVDTEAGY